MLLSENPRIEFTNEDNMKLMARYPDKHFELAIVDPPYGIGRDGSVKTTSKHGGRKAHDFKGWDKVTPEASYFNRLVEISENRIIWGANYFSKYLPSSMGWVFWDKGQRICNSDGELAYTSFQKALRVVEYNRVELQKEGTIHPTQKPIVLYKWLLQNYAKEGDTILDTHVGSGSIMIACWELGFDFVGCELDKDYYEAAIKRFKEHVQAHPKLFTPQQLNGTQLTID